MPLLKILMLAANPTSETELDINLELRRIRDAIKQGGNRDAIRVEYEPMAKPGDLIDSLRSFRPEILHFSGHGSPDHRIILESDTRSPVPIPQDIIEQIFREQGEGIRLVVLNACFTRDQAEKLVRFVPCAIGMDPQVPDDAAITFASEFYGGLSHGESVRRAFNTSLIQMKLHDIAAGNVRELGAGSSVVARDNRVIPVLVESSPGIAADLVLVPRAVELDKPKAPSELQPPTSNGGTAPIPPVTPVRPSGGLPLDRGLGRLIGTTLMCIAAAILLATILDATHWWFSEYAKRLVRFWPLTLILLPLAAALRGSWLYRRSRLLRPEELRLGINDPEHFQGRDDDVARLTDSCLNHPLTFLAGQPGIGKSTLVKVGVLGNWPDDAPLTPILINQWGHDWVTGPRDALAAAFRRPGPRQGKFLVVFDQFDNYLVRHRQRFLTDSAVWKKPDDIARENPFWAYVREQLQGGYFQCLFVTSSDRALGLGSVQFMPEPELYELSKLPEADVMALIDRMTAPGPDGAEVISNPEFGWNALKALLVRDLSVGGLVLPIQLKVALHSLTYLDYEANGLSDTAYKERGRLKGLEALAIQRQVAEVESAVRIDKALLLDLLATLVDRTAQDSERALKSKLVSEADLIKTFPSVPPDTLRRALEMSEDREVTRRIVDPASGALSWTLYHDYLCNAVLEAQRRNQKWQARLDDAFDAWRNSDWRSWGQWWSGLLSPWKQCQLLYHRLLGHLRYGRARRYTLLSLVRVIPYALAVFLFFIGFDRVEQIETHDIVKRLASAATSEVPSILLELENHPRHALPLLLSEIGKYSSTPRDRVRRHSSDDRPVLNLAMGLLIFDSSWRYDLNEGLLAAEPRDIPTIWKVLSRWGRGDGLVAPLRAVFSDVKADPNRRLRAACVLAKLETEARTAERWDAVPELAGALVASVSANPDRYPYFKDQLAPSKGELIGPLEAILRDTKRKEPERYFAANFLADYATEPEVLAGLILDSDEATFETLIPKVKGRLGSIAKRLEDELARPAGTGWIEPAPDPMWQALPPDTVKEIEGYRGLVQDRFALCQTIPLGRFAAVDARLRPSGYRPSRFRPYASGDAVLAAVLWTRDGRRTVAESGLSRDDVQQKSSERANAPERFIPVDIGGYVAKGPDGGDANRFAVVWAEAGREEHAQVFAGVARENLREQLVREQSAYACSTLHAMLGADGQAVFSAICDTTLAGRPRRIRLTQTERGYETTMASLPGPDGNTRDDLEALDVCVVPLTPIAKLSELVDRQTRDLEIDRDPQDKTPTLVQARARFRKRKDREVLETLAPLLKGTADPEVYKYAAYAHARLGEGEAARQVVEKIPNTKWSRLAHRCTLAIVAAYLGEADETGPLEDLVGEKGEQAEQPDALAEASGAYAMIADARKEDPTKRSGALDRAMQLLRKAIDNGYDDFEELQLSPCYDTLRESPEFTKLVASGRPGRQYVGVWLSPRLPKESSTSAQAADPIPVDGPEFARAESHGGDPAAHLEECRALALQGYRPVSLSVAEMQDRSVVAASVWRRPVVLPSAKEAWAIRHANAAISLLLLKQYDSIWPLLRSERRMDPTVRSHLIHRLTRLGLGPGEVLGLRADEAWRRQVTLAQSAPPQPGPGGKPLAMDDVLFHGATSERRALILALGETKMAATPDQAIVDGLIGLYENDPDAGVHGAAEWTLRSWGRGDLVDEAVGRLAGKKPDGRRWRINTQRQTLVEVRGPVEFRAGSPPDEPRRYHGGEETLRRMRIGRRYAISSKEVTNAQFQRFVAEHPRYNTYHTVQASPFSDGPRGTLRWYYAAAYCNWLSGLEHLIACYRPKSGDAYEDGMQLEPDYLERTGYRLPTEAEWEYACRAGTSTRWYHGESEALLAKYAWYLKNAGDFARPTGMLKPNDLGLFDMFGNAMEWCQDGYPTGYLSVSPNRPVEDRRFAEVVRDYGWRYQRGGSYFYQTTLVRSGAHNMNPPTGTNDINGFRVVRTLSPEE